MICLFLATRCGEIAFDDVLIDVEEPLREYEVLHGLVFSRDWSQPMPMPTYYFTGHRAEWRREKMLPKLRFGHDED